MSEQPEGERQTEATEGVSETSRMIGETMQELLATADVTAVFGDPVTVGDRTIITAAEVACGFGFGIGSGEGPTQGSTEKSGGSGGGGGGGARSRPIATIVIEPEGVRVEPIVDVTQIGMAALMAGTFAMFWCARLMHKSPMMEGKDIVPSMSCLSKLFRRR